VIHFKDLNLNEEVGVMEKKLGKVFLGILILTLTFCLLNPMSTWAQKEVILGNIADLTGSTSSVGVPTGNARQNYYEYVNEKGGIWGYKINSVLLDGGESITTETAQFNRLVTKENAVAIIGWSTGGTRALLPIVTRTGITFMGHTCSLDVVQPKEYPYTFIFSPTYEDQFKIVMDYVKKQGAKDIVIVREDLDAWKLTVANIMNEKYAEKIGLNLKDVIVVTPNAPDVTPQMLRAQALKPDFILCPSVPNTLIPTLRDGMKVGIEAKKIIGASLWGTHPVIAQKLGKDIEGYVAISTIPLFGMDNGIMREINEYAKKHPENVKKFEGQTFYIHGWMQAKIFTKAVEAVIKKNGGKMPSDLATSRKQFRDEYENLQGRLMAEDLPPVDNRDHKGWHSAILATPKEGKFVPITEWMTVK
jgi:branched-chain amino acid transport system substrate-binding protein